MKIIVFALSTCAGINLLDSIKFEFDLTWLGLAQRTEYIMVHEWQDESSCWCTNAAAYAMLVSGVALIETSWLLHLCIVIRCHRFNVCRFDGPIAKRKLKHSANRSLNITLRQFSLMAFLLPLSKSMFDCRLSYLCEARQLVFVFDAIALEMDSLNCLFLTWQLKYNWPFCCAALRFNAHRMDFHVLCGTNNGIFTLKFRLSRRIL